MWFNSFFLKTNVSYKLKHFFPMGGHIKLSLRPWIKAFYIFRKAAYKYQKCRKCDLVINNNVHKMLLDWSKHSIQLWHRATSPANYD